MHSPFKGKSASDRANSLMPTAEARSAVEIFMREQVA